MQRGMMTRRPTGRVARAAVTVLALASRAAFTVLALAYSAGAVACASTSAGGAVPAASLSARDQLTIRQHTYVYAVAASSRTVFALTQNGVITYDRVFSRWHTPDARIADDLQFAGLESGMAVTMAADPIEDAVWIGVPGAVILYRVAASQVQRITVAGVPEVITFARGNASDAYVRASGRWVRVSRAGFVLPVTESVADLGLRPSPRLEDVYRQHPSLRGQLAFVLRDASAPSRALPTVRALSGTLSPDRPSEAWIGTAGDGLWLVDANFLSATPLSYGVLDDDIGALTRGFDGVWSAGQGTAPRSGLTFIQSDADMFVWRPSGPGMPLDGVRVLAMDMQAQDVWMATDRGVWRMPMNNQSGAVQWGAVHGLPDDLVLAVVARMDGAWVGTRRGLAFVPLGDTADHVSARGEVHRAGFDGQSVRAMTVVDTQLVLATGTGLHARSLRPGNANTTGQMLFAEHGRALRMVSALASDGRNLLVVTDSMAYVTRGNAWPAAGTDVRAAGAVVAAALDERSVWVAGSRGVIALTRDGGAPRVLRVGRELPAEATALVLDGAFAWVGTRQGLVRVRRARDGGLP